MRLWQLIFRELFFRRLNALLGVLAVVAATACVVGAFTLLRRHDLRTEQVLSAKADATKADMAKLEDDTRKIMRDLGFNLLILPKDQNLNDLYANDYAAKTMPEDYASKLAQSKLASINHVLPSLQRKLKWPEQDRTIILFGTRGELRMASGSEKKPILDLVPPGKMMLGYELQRSLKAQPGDKLTLLGREFTVSKLLPEKGNADDITVYLNLAEAQDLLDMKGQINAIKALECNCAKDRFATIREDVMQVLPDTQVTELASQALARAEQRNRAAKAAHDSLEREKAHRLVLRQEQENFAAILVPLVIVGALILVGVLMLMNVRERAVEIGTLRAIGWKRRYVFVLFLGKAVLLGLLGAMLGCLLGSLVGMFLKEPALAAGPPLTDAADLWKMIDPRLWLIVAAATPLLTAMASWLPALLAARQDPAIVLSRG
ncbi:MAG TPA: ABC transporter permease [Pirellulales bacterium]|jgi:hypothetical protein|nr:ABC transporter permease [Pirellulales bacterium]